VYFYSIQEIINTENILNAASIMPRVDDAIVNGVLCYISCARASYSDQALITICQGFYTHDLIADAKRLLFSLTDETVIQRKGSGKTRAELLDIISHLKSIEETNTAIPKFLADSHSSMPPASGFEVLADHIVSLLTELHTLKGEVPTLTLTVDKIKDCNITDVKEDLHDIKNLVRNVQF